MAKQVVKKSKGSTLNNSFGEVPPLGKIFLIALLILCIPLTGWLISSNLGSKNTSTSNTSETVTQVTRSVSGKSADQDRKDASLAALKILQTSDTSPKNLTIAQRIQLLDQNDLSVIDQKLPTMIQFSSDSTDGLKVSAYQSLITLASVAKSSNTSGKIAVIDSNAWKTDTYADPATGTVFVPLSMFINKGAVFLMEMNYVDGQWKLNPFTLVNEVRIASYVSSGGSTSTPSSKATASSTPKK